MKHPTDEDIEKAATKWFQQSVTGGLKQHFIDGAKWARDQQPKLKTLDDFGWKKLTGSKGVFYKCETPIGYYKVFETNWYAELAIDYPCDDHEHGKQLAQADYERRIKELYA